MNGFLRMVFAIVCIWIYPNAGQSYAQKIADTSYKARFEQLVTVGKRVQSNKDSLPQVISGFKNLYASSQNRQALAYANYYETNLVYLNADHLKAMSMALKCLNNAQRWHVNQLLPGIYSLIGNMHKEVSNYPMAFEAANKGLIAAQQNKDTANIINMLGLKAMFIRTSNLLYDRPIEHDGSIELQFEGLKMAESDPKWERIRIKFYDNIAQHYKDVKDYEKAVLFANKGVYLATKLHEPRSLTYGYCWLGEAKYYQGHQAEGLGYLKKALDISKEIKQPYRIMELSKTLAQFYETSADYKNAFYYMNLHRGLRDSLKVLDNTRQIGELQIKYETVKKDKDIALLNQANEIRSRQMIWIYAGGGLFAIVTAVLLVMYGIIRKRNRELVATNAQVSEQSKKLQVLMQELHHRVKNNLQIVSSLLNLQSSRLADTDARNVLNVSRQRIDAMSIIHQSLYQHDSANMVDIKEYINNLLNSIIQSFGIQPNDMDIKVEVLVKDMDVDIALPLGLILNEWVTNVFKHAYRNTSIKPLLQLVIYQEGDYVKVQIKDNGVGMPPNLWDNPKASFGIKLMKVLMKQIRAVSHISTQPGTTLELHIPYC